MVDITKRVSELAMVIASSITQQSVAADNIAVFVADVMPGSEEITLTIVDISSSAKDSSTRATGVLKEAQELSSLAEQLHALVDIFTL